MLRSMEAPQLEVDGCSGRRGGGGGGGGADSRRNNREDVSSDLFINVPKEVSVVDCHASIPLILSSDCFINNSKLSKRLAKSSSVAAICDCNLVGFRGGASARSSKKKKSPGGICGDLALITNCHGLMSLSHDLTGKEGRIQGNSGRRTLEEKEEQNKEKATERFRNRMEVQIFIDSLSCAPYTLYPFWLQQPGPTSNSRDQITKQHLFTANTQHTHALLHALTFIAAPIL